MINKAFKFRLSLSQAHLLSAQSFAGCCRFVWNWALQQRNDTWKAVSDLPTDRRVEALRACSWREQDAQLKNLKRQFTFLADAPSGILQQTLRDLERAWNNFYAGTAAHPRYHCKRHNEAFRNSNSLRIKCNAQAIRLPKLGWTRYSNSRGNWWRDVSVRYATVVRDGDAWYVSVAVQLNVEPTAVCTGSAVGIDLGIIQDFTIASKDGSVSIRQLPTATLAEQRRMSMLQKTFMRKKLGSANRLKARERARKYASHISHRVRNSLHTITTYLAKNHSQVIMEDLDVMKMAAATHGVMPHKERLNRKIHQHCWGETRRQLGYKCGWYGSELIVTSPAYTSQRCNRCTYTDTANRKSQAKFLCLRCGYSSNADSNAAINILGAGLALLACGAPKKGVEAGTCLGCPIQVGVHQESRHLVPGGDQDVGHDFTTCGPRT